MKVEVPLPSWIQADEACVVAPEGVMPVKATVDGGKASFTLAELPVCSVVVLAESGAQAGYETAYEAALAHEHREF